MIRKILFVLLATASTASAQNVIEKNGSLAMYCRDSANVFQYMKYFDYKRLQDGFTRQFGWEHVLETTSPTLGRLTFAADPQKPVERIYYDVQPYNDGIALLHMHVRLKGKREDLSGTDMCLATQSIAIGN